jgi:hypothetical protein
MLSMLRHAVRRCADPRSVPCRLKRPSNRHHSCNTACVSYLCDSARKPSMHCVPTWPNSASSLPKAMTASRLYYRSSPTAVIPASPRMRVPACLRSSRRSPPAKPNLVRSRWACSRSIARMRIASDWRMPGIGVIGASAIVATVPDASIFKTGRDFAARIGIVSREDSTGGKQRLGPISKQGDRYLRRLFVVGALSVIRQARAHPEKYVSAGDKIPR